MTEFRTHDPIPPATSLGLLQLAIDSDAEAWTTISRIYTPLVYGWARRTGLHDSDASDVTQEVFLNVYLRLRSYEKGRGRFRDWLWKVTRNAVIDLLRLQKVRPVTMDPSVLEVLPKLLEVEPRETDPDHIPNAVLRRALEVIRPRFKETTFQAAWRTLALGLANSDVAAGLQISTTAVYIAKSRVLKELRCILQGLEF